MLEIITMYLQAYPLDPEFLACTPGTVLIVEDDPVCSKILEACLLATPGAEKFEIRRTSNWDEARAILENYPCALVISDCFFDGETENGIDLYNYCRAHFPEMPFLLTSGNLAKVTAALAELPESSAIDFLQKPFSLSDYTSNVSRLLDLKC